MAVLSKHGNELERFNMLKACYSLRDNGDVLKNSGHGWKMAGFKDKTLTLEGKRAALARQRDNVHPLFARYRSLVQDAFPLSVRWKFFVLLNTLGEDEIDGMVCELQDQGVETSIDELREILWARKAWVEFAKANPVRAGVS